LALQGCRQLEKLRMGGVIDGRGLSVDHRHDSVLFPLRGAACLKALDLRDCQGVTDSLLGHIVAGCPQMEQLRLSNTCIKVQVSGRAGGTSPMQPRRRAACLKAPDKRTHSSLPASQMHHRFRACSLYTQAVLSWNSAACSLDHVLLQDFLGWPTVSDSAPA
jgi:hypothetical protein